MISPATDCEGCGHQIGLDASGRVNDHIVCWDGITSKTVTFHSRCNPNRPDVQVRHHISLAPATFGFTPKEIKS